MTVRFASPVALALIASSSFAVAATARYGKPPKSPTTSAGSTTSSSSSDNSGSASSTSSAPTTSTPGASATSAPPSTSTGTTSTGTTSTGTTSTGTTSTGTTSTGTTSTGTTSTGTTSTGTDTSTGTTSTGTTSTGTTSTDPSSSPAPSATSTSTGSSGSTSACSTLSLGNEASFGGFVSFLSGDPWRTPVAALPVASTSSSVIALIGSSKVHPDFGANDGDTTYGIPYTVVSGQTPVTINYQAYGGDSDPGPMPIPASAPVEGGDDRHVLVVNRDTCFAYELYNAHVQGDGSWNADSGAIWDLLNNNDRPFGWTSADAAGLPVLPGLIRYDEVASGSINHALRFTLQKTAASAILPATHYSGTSSAAGAAPMGTRLRLRSDFDISGYSAANQVILRALKTYGMILADNGSNMYLSGTSDSRWNNSDLHNLNQIPATAFEVVNTGSPALTTAVSLATSIAGVVAAPTILSLSANNPTVSAGSSVTLSWSAPLASYFIVSGVGAVRGNSVTVTPTQTTTYTLYATNHFGQATKTVTVTVR